MQVSILRCPGRLVTGATCSNQQSTLRQSRHQLLGSERLQVGRRLQRATGRSDPKIMRRTEMSNIEQPLGRPYCSRLTTTNFHCQHSRVTGLLSSDRTRRSNSTRAGSDRGYLIAGKSRSVITSSKLGTQLAMLSRSGVSPFDDACIRTRTALISAANNVIAA